MKNFTRYYKRLRASYILTTAVLFFLALFFAPNFKAVEDLGENWYEITLNGSVVGNTATIEEAKDALRQARKEIARQQEEMNFIPMDLEWKGEKVIFGLIDDENTLKEAMISVLEESQSETMQRAYTVKINQYTVNLGSSEDVYGLLEAVLAPYDKDDEYQVELVVDPNREINALTPVVEKKEEADRKEKNSWRHAGVDKYFEETFAQLDGQNPTSFNDIDYGLVDLDFAETVEIVEAYLPQDDITPLEEAISQVTAAQAKEEIYEVQPGDTLSQIAQDHDLSMENLVDINPALESENSMIRAGDELKITVPEPELSVIRTEQILTEESYDAPVEYKDNDSWYTTESKVIQQPSAGHRTAAALVTYRNDKEISEDIILEDVDYAAVPKIIERGTKVPPTFVRPVSGGRISSSYGRRNAPTRGASTNHKGIDIAVPTGTAVMASSGGTVTRAGWGSGYGYVVYIQHADGRETRYGHLSRVLVSAGQTVKQGEKIALSGNTGRSTGPHLHFELRINGQDVNPMEYITG